MEDLKEKIEAMVEKVKSDPSFSKKFQEDPVSAAEEVLGMDLPNDEINKILDAVKAKLNFDEGEIMGAIKGFFN